MKRNRFYTFWLCLITTAPVFAQSDSLVLSRLTYEIMNHSEAYSNLRILCKQIGPRLSGSAGAQKAVEETAKMLRDAGADTVYLQPCMVPHWERGAKEQAIANMGSAKKRLRVCALGMSVATPKAGVNAGVIEVANFEELAKLPDATIAGKIVFFNYHMRPELISGAYGDAVRYRSNGPVAAAKKGAVAVVVRSVTHALDTLPHTGTTRYDSNVTKIPAFAISTVDADWLSMQLKKKMVASLILQSHCRQLPDALSYNVVGEVRGKEIPEEIITAGGHLDSWDLGEGAHDDGAGCVQPIEIFRAFKALGLRPKRTIRVVMFMNEENGLRGGNAYAAAAKEKNEKHLFAIESDAGGFGLQTISASGTEAQFAKVKNWEKLLKPMGVIEISKDGGGADIGPLKPLGTMLSSINPHSQRYFDYHHAANDVWEAVNKRELDVGALGMAAICWLVSEHGL